MPLTEEQRELLAKRAEKNANQMHKTDAGNVSLHKTEPRVTNATIVESKPVIQQVPKIYCKYCGNIIDSDSRVCPFCGQILNSAPPQQVIVSTPMQTGMDFQQSSGGVQNQTMKNSLLDDPYVKLFGWMLVLLVLYFGAKFGTKFLSERMDSRTEQTTIESQIQEDDEIVDAE